MKVRPWMGCSDTASTVHPRLCLLMMDKVDVSMSATVCPAATVATRPSEDSSKSMIPAPTDTSRTTALLVRSHSRSTPSSLAVYSSLLPPPLP